ncbi:membrane protein, putative [Babesia bigemina]|uniref:Membrane protein, putative n=1 Tax=Babesia bigemina TaxID=5866 RepID=A0A061DCU9_BABBI|nr:membrane protein, putative [Babesia bigemina]CDR96899.1 membrane protein, putative [Babesia bigemina]|eukprot:XP_012769085.1 membrane protein, putative [Babesia bigemina]
MDNERSSRRAYWAKIAILALLAGALVGGVAYLIVHFTKSDSPMDSDTVSAFDNSDPGSEVVPMPLAEQPEGHERLRDKSDHPIQDADMLPVIEKADGPVPGRDQAPGKNGPQQPARAGFPRERRASNPQPDVPNVPDQDPYDHHMGIVETRIPIISEHVRGQTSVTTLEDVTKDLRLTNLHKGKRCIKFNPEQRPDNSKVRTIANGNIYSAFEPKAPDALFCTVVTNNGQTVVMVNSDVVKTYVVLEKTRYGNIISLFTLDSKSIPSVTQLVKPKGASSYCLNDNYWGLMRSIYELNG